ncbi:ATP-dependent DNA helicase [Trichonephila clavipes]|uniref:ATP-dependent DNA helicase n=1 Tax=Trichonephila clavipes TaxID=2585209 RepID=A0A8X6STI9_TRICX|nr:ATP-dependent DNA helicase [Trichonephila clavipes]
MSSDGGKKKRQEDSPLYTSYGITVDDSFFNGQDDIQDEIIYDEDGDNDISEQIPIDESLVSQQQTLMWNDEMYLTIAPGEAWLDNAPEDALGKDYNKAIDLIDSLISVSAAEASDLILQKRKEFESNIDIEKTLQICRELYREEDADDGEDIRDVAGRLPDQNPFQELYNNPTAEINGDLLYAMLNKLGAIAKKKKENIMSYDDFYDLMRRANEEQREILFHTMHHLISTDEPMREPLFIYLTGPAGSGKTFVIKGIMEIYNRFSDTDGIFNAYIVCLNWKSCYSYRWFNGS